MLDVSSLALYFAVMSITPGPNNVLVTTSGATFGYRATLPHVLGIGVGATLQMLAVSTGLGLVFQHWPFLHDALAWTGAAYLVYLAWRMLQAGVAAQPETRRPFTVAQAIAFQAINPKAWVMAMTAAAVFLPRETPPSTLAVIGAVLLAINLSCVSVWALFGSSMRRLLLRSGYRKAFNLTMSVLLLLTAAFSLRG